LAALEPYRVPAPAQDPPPPDYLALEGDWAYDLTLEVLLQSEAMRENGQEPVVLSRTSFAGMYWTIPQMLAHATVNGALTRPGDLYASGTVSGPDAGSEGSLIELTWRGERPVSLPDGSSRAFLEDGDTVVLRGWAGGDSRPRIDLGEVRGTICPARPLPT
jgi:fumarylacetoacetase